MLLHLTTRPQNQLAYQWYASQSAADSAARLSGGCSALLALLALGGPMTEPELLVGLQAEAPRQVGMRG